MSPIQPGFFEHPQDVLSQVNSWQATGQRCVLVVLVETIGGSVRAPGAMMAVAADGRHVGYLSGGCIDADVVLQAQGALVQNRPRLVRYGQGSPFVDLPLPCGGGLVLAMVPDPNPAQVKRCVDQLLGRQSVSFCLDLVGNGEVQPADLEVAQGRFDLTPKLRLRVAGKGTDALALAQLALSSGYQVQLQTGDQALAAQASNLGPVEVQQLAIPAHIPPAQDDAWTAFVLLFHDLDWEVALLKQALGGSAFFIGAVGSPNTHQRRVEALQAAGLNDGQIVRIHAPVGLVPSMRNASALAISTLAQIIQEFHSG